MSPRREALIIGAGPAGRATIEAARIARIAAACVEA